MLTKETIAPDFSTTDINGKVINLKDYQGQKILLSFYRYASCPLCNLRIHELIKKYPEYEKAGLKVIAIFQSPSESIKQAVGQQNAPFPLIGDPERKIYQQYQVESSWKKLLKGILQFKKLFQALILGFTPKKMEGDLFVVPADFLISPEQKIVEAHYGNDISEHIPFHHIEDFLNIKK